MKFARIYLRAYGSFCDRELAFEPTGVNDLHLIFGPNEAGKSTLLRAITGFLFGIPERTGDAFRHDYSALRVGATLRLADGTRRSLMRRKARKHTLFALDETTGVENTEQPIPEQTLTDLLGGLDQHSYQHLFGLDLQHLIDGGEELLRGEGEGGRGLFQAAAGIAGLRHLIGGLDAEADAIFKPRGSIGRLNRALREFDEQKRLLREVTVRSSDFDHAERTLRDAEAAWRTGRARQQDLRAEQLHLMRVRANLPLLAERAAIQVERAALAPTPTLPVDVVDRRVRSSENLRQASARWNAAVAGSRRCDEAAGALVVRAAVLEQASAIEQAYHALDEYRAARQAMAADARERDARASHLKLLLSAVAAAEVDAAMAFELLPAKTLCARVRQLSEDRAKLADRIEQLATQAVAKQAALSEQAARFAALPMTDTTGDLEGLLAQAANLVDLETRRQELAAECSSRADALRREAAVLWAGAIDDLLLLPLPLPATVAHYADEFEILARERHALAESAATLKQDHAALRREEQALAATGDVVTRGEVSAARAARDAAWRRLRDADLDAATPAPVAIRQVLADAVEGAIRTADRCADQLHADAERSAAIDSIRHRLAELEQALRDSAAQHEALAARGQALRTRWDAVIAPITRLELLPSAAQEWLTKHRQLSERHGEWTRHCAERDRVAQAHRHAVAALNRVFAIRGEPAMALDETPALALARARQAVAAAHRHATERVALERQVDSLRAECHELEAQVQRLRYQLDEQQADWDDAMHRLRLPAGALPVEARTRLDQLDQLAVALAEDAARETLAAQQRESIATFEQRLTTLARACAEPLDVALEVLAERLYAALAAAREAAATQQRFAAEAGRERDALAVAEADIGAAQREIADLVRLAGCASIDDMPAIEAAAERQTRLAARACELDEQLVRDNGCTIAEVLAAAEGLLPDDVTRRLEDVRQEIEVFDRELETAQNALFQARAAYAAIDGGAAAADAAQALASLGARIEQEVRAYTRVRLAGAVLDRVVQSYRERQQGPLLRRATEMFARITLGGFTGLAIDYDDDRQVLCGVRADGAHVLVAGMSQGTRDQLYLALRLAAIEQHLAERGPFPVVVDDLLVQFDDERALATLSLLAELSTRTQVLCFTHHKHLLDLVAASALAQAVTMQSL